MCPGRGCSGGSSIGSLSRATDGSMYYQTSSSRAVVFVISSHLIQSRLSLRITGETLVTRVPDSDILAYCLYLMCVVPNDIESNVECEPNDIKSNVGRKPNDIESNVGRIFRSH
jgi:hypothetical protein